MADDFGNNEIGNPIHQCPSGEVRPYWLEIEMVDEADEPAQYIHYRVVTPGGEEIKGYLDDKGWARLNGLKESGEYRIAFPDLDREAWGYIECTAARGA